MTQTFPLSRSWNVKNEKFAGHQNKTITECWMSFFHTSWCHLTASLYLHRINVPFHSLRLIYTFKKAVPVHWRTVLVWHHCRSPVLQRKHKQRMLTLKTNHTHINKTKRNAKSTKEKMINVCLICVSETWLNKWDCELADLCTHKGDC